MCHRSTDEQITHRVIVRPRLPDQFREPLGLSSQAGLRYLRPSLSGVDAFAAAMFAGAAGRVVAADPATYNVALLRRSAARQSGTSAPVDVVPSAVSDRAGVATLTRDLLAEHVPQSDVMKIDIEGAEVPAVSGGTMVLESHPTIVCEVLERNTDAVRDLVSPLGHHFTYANQVARGATTVRPRRRGWCAAMRHGS